jgi:hypothetical protein
VTKEGKRVEVAISPPLHVLPLLPSSLSSTGDEADHFLVSPSLVDFCYFFYCAYNRQYGGEHGEEEVDSTGPVSWPLPSRYVVVGALKWYE